MNFWKQRSPTGDLRGNSGPSGRDLVLLWYCGATYKSKNMDARDYFGMLILLLLFAIVVVNTDPQSILLIVAFPKSNHIHSVLHL